MEGIKVKILVSVIWNYTTFVIVRVTSAGHLTEDE